MFTHLSASSDFAPSKSLKSCLVDGVDEGDFLVDANEKEEGEPSNGQPGRKEETREKATNLELSNSSSPDSANESRELTAHEVDSE